MAGIRLRRWELDILDEMEAIRLRWLNRDRDDDSDVNEAQPVTPALVSALFG